MDEIRERIRCFFDHHGIDPQSEHILVACSGGADSLALLYLLKTLFQVKKLGVAHFDHGIRGSESLADHDFVKEVSGKLDLPFYSSHHGQAWTRGNTEGLAREYRYAFLNQTASHHGYDWIALGHTADDQIETILYKFFRGSGKAALAGMPERRERVIRPLLGFYRRELEAVLTKAGISWREDSTNRDLKYRRNAIRHSILPTIEGVFPAFRQKLLFFAEESRLENSELQAYLDAFKIISHHGPSGIVYWDWECLKQAPRSLVLKMLAALLAENLSSSDLPRRAFYQNLSERLKNNQSKGGILYQGRAGGLLLDRKRLYFYPPSARGLTASAEKEFLLTIGNWDFPWGQIRISLEDLPSLADRNFFKAEALRAIFWIGLQAKEAGFIVRPCRAGDFFRGGKDENRRIDGLIAKSGVPRAFRSSVMVITEAKTGACHAVLVPALPEKSRIGESLNVTRGEKRALCLRFVFSKRGIGDSSG